jgi:hypothetical protein
VKGSRVEIHDRSALKRIADACALPSEGRQ